QVGAVCDGVEIVDGCFGTDRDRDNVLRRVLERDIEAPRDVGALADFRARPLMGQERLYRAG
ncbi:MAG TPA: hypothetical protein VLC51_02145, partial [Nitrospira sp.]|nr:hypothetical protein [Nitrospira sp.]